MAREEIIKELERVERAIFMEQMADFMNWGNYHKLRAEQAELKKRLAEI